MSNAIIYKRSFWYCSYVAWFSVEFPSSIKSIADLKHSEETTMEQSFSQTFNSVKLSSLFKFMEGKRKQLKQHSGGRAVTKHLQQCWWNIHCKFHLKSSKNIKNVNTIFINAPLRWYICYLIYKAKGQEKTTIPTMLNIRAIQETAEGIFGESATANEKLWGPWKSAYQWTCRLTMLQDTVLHLLLLKSNT